ncbi:sensor histidine kinase [Tenacibaculum piscium]|uniref:sensor histidine kinase n=3 Tax=Tenacibaculum piscium TaxID=1458515 RepID=UPI001F2CC68B|nr:histidine kinase [Tenacibaculum piscium]
MNKILNTYSYLLNIGVPQKKSVEAKKIRLLNAFCITWSVMIVIITIFDLIFERELYGSLILHGISYVIITGIFYLQFLQNYHIARIVFIIAIISITFIFANFTTPLMLIENFYFLYPLVGILFIEKKWINMLFLLLCFGLYFIPNLFLNMYPKNMILPVLVFCIFLGTFVILNYSEQLNKKQEKKLRKRKIKLEKAYAKLEKQKENELALLRLQTLKAQMNPHFMFNTINSIQNLILKNNKEDAYDYLTRYAVLMRENLKISNKNFTSLDIELVILNKYLELEKLRFGDSFYYTIENLENNKNIEIPSQIIQPFVEEAIRYRLLHQINQLRELKITFHHENKMLVCTIIDNGIGIAKSIEMKDNNKMNLEVSLTAIIEKRVALLKDFYNIKIHFKYIQENFKTKVILKMSYK